MPQDNHEDQKEEPVASTENSSENADKSPRNKCNKTTKSTESNTLRKRDKKCQEKINSERLYELECEIDNFVRQDVTV